MKPILIFATLLISVPSLSSAKASYSDIDDVSLEELLSAVLARTSLLDVPHFHSQGEWMVSYKYNHMAMKDNRLSTEHISTSEVLTSYMVSPVAMTMKMHMIGFMYGLSDRINLMGMLNFMDVSMDAVNRMAMSFNTHSKTFGDTRLSMLYRIDNSHNSQIFTTIGLSLPTGDINIRGDTPMGTNQKLPYPMQLGSGTVDPNFALTYIRSDNDQAYGFSASSILRFYDNANDYHLGNQFKLVNWYSRVLSDVTTVFVLSDARIWGDIKGADPELNPMMTPTADPDLRGGTSVALGAGVNFSIGSGSWNGTKLSFQYSKPLYQDLDGPQLETDGQLRVGLVYSR